MKRLFKRLAMLMSLVLMVNATCISAFAASDKTMDDYKSTITASGFSDSFSVYNDDGSVSFITRNISSDGKTTVVIHSANGTKTINGHVDFSSLPVSGKINTAITRANVHSSTFNHTFVTSNEFEASKDTANLSKDVIFAILSSGSSLTGTALQTFANKVYNNLNKDVHSILIEESIYEVTFKSDGSYYTHCFHENLIAYDANGNVLPKNSYNLTYQQVGG